MNRTFTYTISPPDDELTVGTFLKKRGYSRHIQSLLKRTPNGICLDGHPVFTSCPLRSGQTLVIQLKEELSASAIPPVPLQFSIVYEDDDILVINKPAGMPVHPSYGNYENTLANGVAWYYEQQGLPFVFRCINRLDRDTTGLLILAKHSLSGAVLSEDMKKRRIHRTYLALVSGIPSPASGTIDAPIDRRPDSILERCVSPHGEPAITHYRVVKPLTGASLVEFSLETGRTHQIRVHMTYLGHPLLGDFLYNPTDHRCGRQALHSFSLAFTHPITGKDLTFTAPLPPDMAECLQLLE